MKIEQRIVEMRNKGKTIREIQKKLEVSLNRIYYAFGMYELRKRWYPINRDDNTYKINVFLTKRLKKMKMKGEDLSQWRYEVAEGPKKLILKFKKFA